MLTYAVVLTINTLLCISHGLFDEFCVSSGDKYAAGVEHCVRGTGNDEALVESVLS